MSQINKLQLVDPNKLNEILNLLKNKKLLQGIYNEDEFKLEEAKDKMDKTMANCW